MKRILSKLKPYQWGIVLAVLAVVLSGTYGYAALHLGYSQTERDVAADLAALSGLDDGTVFDLYDTRESWQLVKENIFIYKAILADDSWYSFRYHDKLALIESYDPNAILAVYQFLDKYERDEDLAEDLLEKHAQGASLEEIFAAEIAQHDYKNYRPADQEQIRKWLADGILPEDIVMADTIAIAKDMTIQDVLAKKSAANTWAEVGQELDYQTKTEAEKVSLTLPTETGGKHKYAANDYETIANNANREAAKQDAADENALGAKYRLSPKQINSYQEAGCALPEIRNACRLAAISKVSADKILKERQAGESWESLVQKYGRERKNAK
ncbi:MAG: hypothetical protein ACM3QZ_04600 [Solirubrobacterales bacterium]